MTRIHTTAAEDLLRKSLLEQFGGIRTLYLRPGEKDEEYLEEYDHYERTRAVTSLPTTRAWRSAAIDTSAISCVRPGE